MDPPCFAAKAEAGGGGVTVWRIFGYLLSIAEKPKSIQVLCGTVYPPTDNTMSTILYSSEGKRVSNLVPVMCWCI